MMVCMVVPLVGFRPPGLLGAEVNRFTVLSGQAARAGGFIRPHSNGLAHLMVAACLLDGLRKRSAIRAVLNCKRRCHVGLSRAKMHNPCRPPNIFLKSTNTVVTNFGTDLPSATRGGSQEGCGCRACVGDAT